MRILVSFEPGYLAYQGAIAGAIRILRPLTEVQTTTPNALGEEVERLDPELVICTRPNTVDPGGRIAWFELSLESTRPSKVCVGGRHSEPTNPTLEVMLEVIDEIEKLTQTDNPLRRC